MEDADVDTISTEVAQTKSDMFHLLQVTFETRLARSRFVKRQNPRAQARFEDDTLSS